MKCRKKHYVIQNPLKAGRGLGDYVLASYSHRIASPEIIEQNKTKEAN